MGEPIDEVFLLLGAGASVPAGVPHARGFVSTIREYLAALPAPDNEALLKTFDDAAEALGQVLDHPPDLETLYQAVDDALDYHFGPRDPLEAPPLLAASRGLERLHYEIKRCIQRWCFIDDEHRLGYLDPLLADLRARPGLPIVSFNYDNVIEAFCEKHRVGYVDPIIDSTPPDGDELLLLKLHGSVTWFMDKDRTLRKGSPSTFQAWTLTKALRSATLETPLIYPSQRKLPIQMPFLESSARFQQILLTHRTCVAVGYSFRDSHVAEWFSHAMRVNRDLRIVLVSPTAEDALASLIAHDPRTDWPRRVLRAPGSGFVQDAVKLGLKNLAEHASQINLSSVVSTGLRWRSVPEFTFDHEIASMAPTFDGTGAYFAVPGVPGRIEHLDLSTGHRIVLTTKPLQPRGMVATGQRKIHFVQNQLWKSSWLLSSGAGAVRELDTSTGQIRTLTRLTPSALRGMLTKVTAFNFRQALARAPDHILSWPADIAWQEGMDALVATEAKRLALVSLADGSIRRIAGAPLTFNLHAVDIAGPGLALGLELGIAQSKSWGRVVEFDFGTMSAAGKVHDLGLPRLFDICALRSLGVVLIVQMLPWPKGSILVYRYPAMDLQPDRCLDGFDSPAKIAFHRAWNFVLCTDRQGIHRIPLAAFA